MTTICQKSEVAVGQAQVMAEAIEEAVVEPKTKSDESEEEGVTENKLPVTEQKILWREENDRIKAALLAKQQQQQQQEELSGTKI